MAHRCPAYCSPVSCRKRRITSATAVVVIQRSQTPAAMVGKGSLATATGVADPGVGPLDGRFSPFFGSSFFSGLYVGQSTVFEHGGEFFHGECLPANNRSLISGVGVGGLFGPAFSFSGRHGGVLLGSEPLAFSCRRVPASWRSFLFTDLIVSGGRDERF